MKEQHSHDAYYIKLPGGVATQGDIWSNLPAALSGALTGRGLVITPRCDFAHDKAQFVNYLPILSLKEYLITQGGFELLQHELKNVRRAMDQVACEFRIDRLLAAGIPLEDALAVAETNMGTKDWEVARTRKRVADLREYALRVDMLCSVLKHPQVDVEQLGQLVNKKALGNYKKQIARNTVADLHFLPPCPPFFDEPAVVLLRCIGTARRELFSVALRSVTTQDWERALTSVSPLVRPSIDEKPERIARLRSPYLEALMARFAALFSRVGTRDLTDAALIQMIGED